MRLFFTLSLIGASLAAFGQSTTPASVPLHNDASRELVRLDAPRAHRATIVRIVDQDGFSVRTHSTAPGSLLQFSTSGLPPGRYEVRTNDPGIASASFTKDKRNREP